MLFSCWYAGTVSMYFVHHSTVMITKTRNKQGAWSCDLSYKEIGRIQENQQFLNINLRKYCRFHKKFQVGSFTPNQPIFFVRVKGCWSESPDRFRLLGLVSLKQRLGGQLPCLSRFESCDTILGVPPTHCSQQSVCTRDPGSGFPGH